MTPIRQTVLGVVHAIAWVGIVWIIDVAMRESDARAAYGLLCAWWASLYLALLLGTAWRALPALCVAMTLALAIDTSTGRQLLYRDPPSVDSLGFAGLALFLCALWASPLIANAIARSVRDQVMSVKETLIYR